MTTLATTLYLQNKNYSGVNDINKLRNDFYGAKITVSYDSKLIKVENQDSRRIIFTSVKGMRSQNFDKISYECNGLILEAGTWRPLVIPCPTPKTSANNNILNKLINKNECEIYKITNGTVVYFYYWNNTWNLSTTRGIDMANVSPISLKKSYKEIINEILTTYNSCFNDFCEILDKSSSYAFIIQHSDMHVGPMINFKNNIIFVHKATVAKVDSAKVSHNADSTNAAEHKWCVELERNHHGLSIAIPYQEKIDLSNKTLKSVYTNLSNSLDRWINREESEVEPLYGYIIVSPDKYSAAGDHSYVLLESSLMRKIRQFIYDSKYNKYGNDKQLATIVDAFLGSDKKIFIKLFPQYTEIYEQIEKLQLELCKKITVKYLNGLGKSNLLTDNMNKSLIETKINTDPIDFFIDEINLVITIKNETDYAHILPYINSTKYTNIYFNLIKTDWIKTESKN